MSTRMNWPGDFINKIICGDCLEVMKEMSDECVDLILTDPPYGIGKKYGNFNDKFSNNEYQPWLMNRISEAERILKKDGIIFVFMPQINMREWILWFPKKSRIFAGVKNFTQFHNIVIQYSWSPIVFWEKDKSKIEPVAGKRDWCLEHTASAWGISGIKQKDHPAIRDLSILNYLIKNFSLENDTVLDCFNGFGSTSRAAKDLKRNFVGIEIDPEYCKIAEERLAQGVL